MISRSLGLHGCPPVELLGSNVVDAARLIKASTTFNSLRSPDFWEAWMAVQLGGTKTDRKAEYDVHLEDVHGPFGIEVKFSNAFYCSFPSSKGVNISRYVFKWLLTKRQVQKRNSLAVLFLGMDVDETLYSWVVPFEAITNGSRSITMTAPSARSNPANADCWNVPPTEILPALLRIRRSDHRESDLFDTEEIEQ